MKTEKVVTLELSAINTSGLQLRVATSREHVDSIVELFDADKPTWPAALPPVVVFDDGKQKHLADGHHRIEGAREAGCAKCRAIVRKGTKQDAIKYACGANADHGLPRSNADKRNAIKTAWELNKGNTDRAIAKLCKVSHTFASYVLKELRTPPESCKIATNENALTSVKIATPEEGTGGAEARGGGNSPEPSSGKASELTTAGSAPAGECPSPSAPPVPAVAIPATPATDDGKPHGFDQAGLPIPSAVSAEAFAALDFFDDLERLLVEATRAVNNLGRMPGAELYRSEHLKLTQRTKDGESEEHFHCPDLANALKELRHWRPFASVCPHCKGKPARHCKICFGLPYLTESAWQRLPEKTREAMKAERIQGGK